MNTGHWSAGLQPVAHGTHGFSKQKDEWLLCEYNMYTLQSL